MRYTLAVRGEIINPFRSLHTRLREDMDITHQGVSSTHSPNFSLQKKCSKWDTVRVSTTQEKYHRRTEMRNLHAKLLTSAQLNSPEYANDEEPHGTDKAESTEPGNRP